MKRVFEVRDPATGETLPEVRKDRMLVSSSRGPIASASLSSALSMRTRIRA
jgi:hypothetical protein